MLNEKRLLRSALMGLALCLPVTGFLYGVFSCQDCVGLVGGSVGRIFIGLLSAINTTLTLGAPVDNEAGSSHTNIRLFVFLTFLALTVILYLKSKKRIDY